MDSKIKILIQQTSFKDKYHEALIGVMLLHQEISNLHHEIFKSQKITTQQYNVLRILRGKYPEISSVHYIKSRMIDKMSDVSRLVERLYIAGYLTRTPNEDDRRLCDIKISPLGLELLSELDEVANNNAIINKLDESEVENLIQLIEKML